MTYVPVPGSYVTPVVQQSESWNIPQWNGFFASIPFAAPASAPYTLPTASTTVVGGVRVDGTTITIAGGTISASPGSYVLPTASTSVLGGVKVDGTTVTISGGVLSAAAAYTLPTASTSVLGAVMVDGTSITISGGGVISAAAG